MVRVVAEGIGKRYRLTSRCPGRGIRGRPTEALGDGWVWALRDVSFRVAAGETVGIIGRNAAGKSTLLKILARITDPTTGRAVLRGRVASLLEVGTGFHSELTGRENIYLNGSILGMRKREVDAKLDAIVAFSEIGEFLDTPVKYYSSGMHLRLGFAVAAHLQPDVLLVDEILGIGDAHFQRRCLGVVDGLRSDGRTVLLVSHNLALVRAHCQRALWLDAGKVIADGPARELVEQYLASLTARTLAEPDPPRWRSGRGRVGIAGHRLLPGGSVRSGDRVCLCMRLRAAELARSLTVTVSAFTALGVRVFECSSGDAGVLDLPAGEHEVTVQMGPLPLCAQRYYLDILVSGPLGEVLDHVERACVVDVIAESRLARKSGLPYEAPICEVPAHWSFEGERQAGGREPPRLAKSGDLAEWGRQDEWMKV